MRSAYSISCNLVAAFLLFLSAANVFAQTPVRDSEKGFIPGVPFASSDFENVNLTNGNLVFSFPLGAIPAGRSSLTSTLFLRYNSKLWKKHIENINDNGDITHQYFLGDDPDGGWNYGDSYHLLVTHRSDGLDSPVQPCNPNGTANIDGIYTTMVQVESPDGSKREFWPTGYSLPAGNHGRYFNVTPTGEVTVFSGSGCTTSTSQVTSSYLTYYSVDGSGIQLRTYHDSTWELYTPDGTVISANGNRITDRNGNYIQYGSVTLPDSSQASGWFDQFGRYVARKVTATDEDTIYRFGTNGQLLTTKVRWKTITVLKKYETECADCGFTRGQTSYQVLYMFWRVVDYIEAPNGQRYTFDYKAHDGEVEFDPNGGTTNQNWSPGWGEVKSLTMPSTAKSNYDYKIYQDPYILLLGDHIKPANVVDTSGRTVEKTLSYYEQYDGQSPVQKEDKWTYATGHTFGGVTGPDGTSTSQAFYDLNQDQYIGGYTYKTTSSSGTIDERLWQYNNPSGFSPGKPVNPYVKAEFHTIPDASGQPSLTAIKEFECDKNGNITKITEYDWVAYSTISHDSSGRIAGLPSGLTPKRITQTSYFYATASASDTTTVTGYEYWNPSAPRLRGLVTATEIQDSNATPKSRIEMFYDFASYGSNTIAGNVTQTKTWDSFKNGTGQSYSNPLTSTNSVSTSAEYDSHGMPVTMTDANGNITHITYGSITCPAGSTTGLYPTQTIIAYGTPVARTSAAGYDCYAGLMTTATDVDNGISTVTEYDVWGRPTKIRNAAGTLLESWTQTTYHDGDTSDGRQYVIVKSDVEAIGDGRQVGTTFYDQLGRVRLKTSLEDASTQSPTNEADGIKVQTRYGYDFNATTNVGHSYQLVSNPYRASTSTAASAEETMGWTLSTGTNNGRHSEVQTFSGAGLPTAFGGSNTNSTGIVQTDIDANATTVTDQANKVRRSITNGLGQLIRVDEPTSSGLGAVTSPNQPTSYIYDVLNNLLTVTQAGSGTEQCGISGGSCSQTRTFTYSSLSRLLTATNPESGTISYGYDPNGNLTSKTDARGIVTSYIYDQLNRVTHRNYTNEPTGSETADVSYYYGTSAPAVGKLTKVSSSVSTTEYTRFDILGRVTSHKQTTDGGDPAGYTTAYTYKLNGALDEETYPSTRVVKNQLDANGDLSAIESKKTSSAGFWRYADTFTYNAAGAVTSVQLGNGLWEKTVFNSRLQPIIRFRYDSRNDRAIAA